jgi:putative effector of murein hydrolase LrgA (UPF0299 family)
MRINLTLIIALFCAVSVFIPWILEALEYPLPAGIRGLSTLIGLLGFVLFLVVMVKARRPS